MVRHEDVSCGEARQLDPFNWNSSLMPKKLAFDMHVGQCQIFYITVDVAALSH